MSSPNPSQPEEEYGNPTLSETEEEMEKLQEMELDTI